MGNNTLYGQGVNNGVNMGIGMNCGVVKPTSRDPVLDLFQ
jgi:hypothetical protein